MASYKYLTYELLDEGTIARIMLNRPGSRNAQNRGLLVELGEAMLAAEADDQVRVVILGGAGPMFSAGHDLGSREWREEHDPGPGQHPTYRPVFDAHGWGDICDRLHELLARGDNAAMAALITGEMLDSYSVAATWEELPGVLARRYGGLVDRVAPYGADLGSASGRERWRAVVAAIRNNKMI